MTANPDKALQTLLSIALDTSTAAQYRIIASRYLREMGQAETAAEVLVTIARDAAGDNDDQFEAAAELWRMEQRTKAIAALTAISDRLPANNRLRGVARRAVVDIQEGRPAPEHRFWVEPMVMPAPPPGPSRPEPL